MTSTDATTVSFAKDIKPFFQQYVGNMAWRMDLTDYDQVKANAKQLFQRIEGKSMPPPPFPPFSDDFIASFNTWMQQEYPE